MAQLDQILLSVVMPVFNERATVAEIVRRVLAVPLRKELIVVDDGSTDGTRETLREAGSAPPGPELRVLFQPVNRGKGAVLRAGIKAARGDYVVIQDADLGTTRASTSVSCSRAWSTTRTSSMGRASSAARSVACCSSGTPWATSS